VVVDELHDFAEVGDRQAERHGLFAAVELEAAFVEAQVDEGDVRAVHGLDVEAVGSDVDIDFGDEFLDGLYDLLEDHSVFEASFEHVRVFSKCSHARLKGIYPSMQATDYTYF
jgi:hypothetical protein